MQGTLKVFLRDEVQELIDALAHTFQVRITVFSPQMEELRVGLQNPGSPFCHLVQKDLRRLHLCQSMDRQMCQRAQALGRNTHYRCHAGLLEAVLPLVSGDHLVGYVMVGQFRDTAEPNPEVEQRWADQGGDPDHLREAFLATPLLDAVSREKMLTLASMTVQFVVNQAYVGVRPEGLMDQITGWVDGRLQTEIRLEDLAAHLGKGVSTVAHAVKTHTGHSFTHLVHHRRVRRFEDLLRQRPDLRIQEGAVQAGFSDPLYFSRVYRKLRGQSPSEFVAGLRQPKAARISDEGRGTVSGTLPDRSDTVAW